MDSVFGLHFFFSSLRLSDRHVALFFLFSFVCCLYFLASPLLNENPPSHLISSHLIASRIQSYSGFQESRIKNLFIEDFGSDCLPQLWSPRRYHQRQGSRIQSVSGFQLPASLATLTPHGSSALHPLFSALRDTPISIRFVLPFFLLPDAASAQPAQLSISRCPRP